MNELSTPVGLHEFVGVADVVHSGGIFGWRLVAPVALMPHRAAVFFKKVIVRDVHSIGELFRRDVTELNQLTCPRKLIHPE